LRRHEGFELREGRGGGDGGSVEGVVAGENGNGQSSKNKSSHAKEGEKRKAERNKEGMQRTGEHFAALGEGTKKQKTPDKGENV
jgi:hypothetical protein